MIKITPAFIDKLLRLRAGESLPSSVLRGDWVEELLRDGVLVSRSHGSKRSVSASSPENLEQALRQIDERLGNLEKMKCILTEDVSRAEQATDTGNSKLVTVRSCPGFPVNSYEPIVCQLDGCEMTIEPQEGSFLFIADYQSFFIPEDVIIVNVENMENFRLIRRQRVLFSSVLPNERLLFVSRYPQSCDLRSWLLTIPNRYVHFGDFDLAGIHIFLTEFQKYLGCRSSFLIPKDVEERLSCGSSERYKDQYQKFKNLSADSPSLQRLIDLIHKYHRCYDQEGYIGDEVRKRVAHCKGREVTENPANL